VAKASARLVDKDRETERASVDPRATGNLTDDKYEKKSGKRG